MSVQLALCARVLRDPPSFARAIDWGITPEDFTIEQAKSLWNLIQSYSAQPSTLGSVIPEALLRAWWPPREGHSGFEAPADMPGMTVEALCHEVRRERIVTESNAAAVRFTQELQMGAQNPATSLAWYRLEVQRLQELGAASGGPAWLTATDLAKPAPPLPWLVEGIGLLYGAPMLFVGAPSSFKTMAAQSMTLALAAPHDALVWGAFARAKRCRVAHLDGDFGEHLARDVYQRLALGMGLDLAMLGDFLHFAEIEPCLTDEHTAYFEKVANAHDVVILDSFDALRDASVSENDAAAAAPLKMLRRISQKTGCCFVVIHHDGKGTTDARSAGRGTSAITASAGGKLAFTRDEGADVVTVRQGKARGRREARPFTLNVSDTANGGLRLTVLDEQTRAAGEAARAADKLRTTEARVIAFLGERGGSWVGGQEALRSALQLDKNDSTLRSAISELSTSRRILCSKAPRNQTEYRLMDTPIPATTAVAGGNPGVPALGPSSSCFPPNEGAEDS